MLNFYNYLIRIPLNHFCSECQQSHMQRIWEWALRFCIGSLCEIGRYSKVLVNDPEGAGLDRCQGGSGGHLYSVLLRLLRVWSTIKFKSHYFIITATASEVGC